MEACRLVNKASRQADARAVRRRDSVLVCLSVLLVVQGRGVAGGGCLGEFVFALTHRDKLLG